MLYQIQKTHKNPPKKIQPLRTSLTTRLQAYIYFLRLRKQKLNHRLIHNLVPGQRRTSFVIHILLKLASNLVELIYIPSAPDRGHPSILGILTVIQNFSSQCFIFSVPKSRNVQLAVRISFSFIFFKGIGLLYSLKIQLSAMSQFVIDFLRDK